MPSDKGQGSEPMSKGMWAVVASKALTALLLWGTLVLLLFARKEEPSDFFSRMVRDLFRGNPPGLAIQFIAGKTEFVSRTMITRLAFATAAYAVVESTEAIGLIMRKVWAEWLVVVVTLSFIPIEIGEMVREPSPAKGVTMAINLAILAYLVKRIVHKRGEHRAAGGIRRTAAARSTA